MRLVSLIVEKRKVSVTKMKNKRRILTIGIGVCILFVGISLVILQAGKSREEGIVFENFEKQLTDFEKEDDYYGYLEKYLAMMLNRSCKTSDCEVDINHLEGKIVGVGIDVAVSEESVGYDALKTDISDCISKALNVTEDSIAVSVHQ